MNARAAERGDTRETLLLAALEEFAETGIEATPIARILQRAGARNSSALHYHFGSKEGLIRDLVGFVQDAFDNERAGPTSRLLTQPQVTLEEALDWFVRPYVVLITREPWGFSAVRFLALIQLEQNRAGWEALRKRGVAPMEQLRTWVVGAEPNPDDEALRARLLFFIDSVIQGFASHRHLEVSFLGDMRFRDIEALGAFYMDCGLRLIRSSAGPAKRLSSNIAFGS